MIAADGRAVIADFGTAARLGDDGALDVYIGHSIGGNTSHLAPEVLNGGAELAMLRGSGHVTIPYGRQSVFAAGILMHEIATGEHPITGYPRMCLVFVDLDDYTV